MEKKIKYINLGIVCILVLSIMIGTAIQINQTYLANQEKVINERIIEEAKRCVLESECSGSIITLEELITKGYADDVIHPRTKEYLLRSSYVDLDTNTFYWIEGNTKES